MYQWFRQTWPWWFGFRFKLISGDEQKMLLTSKGLQSDTFTKVQSNPRYTRYKKWYLRKTWLETLKNQKLFTIFAAYQCQKLVKTVYCRFSGEGKNGSMEKRIELQMRVERCTQYLYVQPKHSIINSGIAIQGWTTLNSDFASLIFETFDTTKLHIIIRIWDSLEHYWLIFFIL